MKTCVLPNPISLCVSRKGYNSCRRPYDILTISLSLSLSLSRNCIVYYVASLTPSALLYGVLLLWQQVVRLFDVIPSGNAIVLVFECMTSDLAEVIKAHGQSRTPTNNLFLVRGLLQHIWAF